jgi:hypothetical protein
MGKARDWGDVGVEGGPGAIRREGDDPATDIPFDNAPPAQTNGEAHFAEELPGHSKAPVPVTIYTYDEMVNLPPPDFAVHGLVVRRAKDVMFGPSNVFRSFIATDLGGSVSTGNTYHGLAVKEMKVFYVANEGAHGVGRKRIAAWMAYHGILPEARRNIFLIKAETILPNETSRNNLLAAIRQIVEPGEDFFIIFDVLRGTMTGSESDDEAAHAWTAAAEILIAEGATILTVTHSPYSEDARMRGHSHLWGSFDARLQVEGDKEKRTAVLKIDRIKDHESTGQWGFTLDEQETDEHPGEFSLVPRLDSAVRPKTRGPAPKQNALLREVIEQAIDEAWAMITPFSDGPAIKAVSDRIVRDRYYLRMGEVEPTDERAKASQRQAFYRPLKAMIEKGQVRAHPIDKERFIWLP